MIYPPKSTGVMVNRRAGRLNPCPEGVITSGDRQLVAEVRLEERFGAGKIDLSIRVLPTEPMRGGPCSLPAGPSALGPHSEDRMAFKVEFSPRARDNLKKLRKRDQQIILDAIASQLTDQPDQSTRKRKRLEDNLLSPWELRVGDFRVFY